MLYDWSLERMYLSDECGNISAVIVFVKELIHLPPTRSSGLPVKNDTTRDYEYKHFYKTKSRR